MADSPQGFNIENIQHAQIRCLSDSPWADFHKQLDNYWYGKKRGNIDSDTHFIYQDTAGYGVIESPHDFGILDEAQFNILHELYWQYRMYHFNTVNQKYPEPERIPDSEWNPEIEVYGIITTELARAGNIISQRKTEGIEIKLLLDLGV